MGLAGRGGRGLSRRAQRRPSPHSAFHTSVTPPGTLTATCPVSVTGVALTVIDPYALTFDLYILRS
jgi:hypothetical protein